MAPGASQEVPCPYEGASGQNPLSTREQVHIFPGTPAHPALEEILPCSMQSPRVFSTHVQSHNSLYSV